MSDAEPVNTHSWRPRGGWTLPVSMPPRRRSVSRSARPATAVLRRGSLSGTSTLPTLGEQFDIEARKAAKQAMVDMPGGRVSTGLCAREVRR